MHEQTRLPPHATFATKKKKKKRRAAIKKASTGRLIKIPVALNMRAALHGLYTAELSRSLSFRNGVTLSIKIIKILHNFNCLFGMFITIF